MSRVFCDGAAKVSPDVEHLVLDLSQYIHDVRVEPAQRDRKSDLAVRLVNVSVCKESGIQLAGLAHVTEAGLPAIPSARVYARQVDHFTAPSPTCREGELIGRLGFA
jgi:hypothetical protein